MKQARSKKKSRVSIDRRQQESSGFVYEGSLNAIFVFSLDGKLLDANRAAADFYGYSTKELTGQKLDNLFHRDYRHTLPTILDRLTSGESIRLDSLHSRKDGTHVDVEVEISPVAFRDEPCGLMIVRDISERKQVEKTLRENEQRFRQLLDSMSSGVAIYEPVDDGNDFVFIDFNKAAEHIEGVRKENLEGKSVQVVFPGVHDLGLFEVFRRVYETGNPEHHPASLYQDERKSGWRENYVFKLPTGEIVAVYDDVTELMKARRELEDSERKYRDLYDNAPDMFVSIDAETANIRECNDRLLKALGYQRDEVIGQPVFILYHPDCHEQAQKYFDAFVETGEVHDAELQLKRKDGSRIDVLLNVSAHRDKDGKVIYSRSVLRDITERRRAQEDLRQYEKIASATKDLMALVDSNYIYQAANQAYLTAYAVDREELTGKAYKDLVGEDVFQNRIKNRFERCLSGEDVRVETWIDYPGSGRRYMEVAYNPFYEPDRSITGVVISARDLTEWKEAQDEKANLEERLQQAQKLESLGVLAGGVAHEFNNLLTTILGNADMARSLTPSASPVSSNIDRICQASQRAADLVSQMLAYAGKGAFLVRELDLSETIEGMNEILESMIPEGTELKLNLTADLPPLKADQAQIRQVVKNLVANSAESLGSKGNIISVSTGSLTIDSENASEYTTYTASELVEGEYIFVEVADYGEGMEEDTILRIYEPFFSTRFAGRGLGLPAVLGIVRGHNGNIIINSEPGVGTKVKVLLPVESS